VSDPLRLASPDDRPFRLLANHGRDCFDTT